MQAPIRTYPRGLRAAAGDWLIAIGSATILALAWAFLVDWLDWYDLPNLQYDPPGPYLVLVGVLSVLLHGMTGRVQSVVIDADGLRLVTAHGLSDRWISWGHLRSIERLPGRWLLHTTGGPVRITDSLVRRDDLLTEIERHIGESAHATWSRGWPAWLLDTALQAGLLGSALAAAEWLQDPWGGRLCDANDRGSVWLRQAGDAGAGWYDVQPAVALVVGLLLGLQVLLLLMTWRRRRVARVELDDHGVRIHRLAGRPTELPWASIRSARVGWCGLRIETAAGTVVPGSSLRRVADLARRINDGAADVPLSEREPEAEVFGRGYTAWLIDALLPSAILAGGMAGALSTLTIDRSPEPWAYAVGALVALAGWSLLRHLRVDRVLVAPDALRIERLAGEPITIPWPALRSIQRTIGGWRLATTRGPVSLWSSLQRPGEFQLTVRQAIERHRAPLEESSVDDRELADWLQVGEGEVLRVRALRLRRVVVGATLWLGAAVAITPLLRHLGSAINAPLTTSVQWVPFDFVGLLLLLFWLLHFPLTVVHALRADALRRVEASAYGLRWREGRYWSEAGWDEVTNVALVERAHREALFYWTQRQKLADREVLVECGGRSFRFNPRDDHAPELQTALGRLMAARSVGRTVPGLPGISPRSLSRAEPAAGSDASRGLSRL